MPSRSVTHATIVAERTYPASVGRVFAAWADPETHGRWNSPGEGWDVVERVHEFRVGGRQYSRFGPPGQPVHHSEGWFADIVPNARIVSSGAMYCQGERTSVTLCTVELLPVDTGTQVIVTDQSVFIGDGDHVAQRKEGWQVILAKLERVLSLHS